MPKDLFSDHAKNYAAFRPAYPQALYDFIYKYVEQFDQAWDCGTGNGQVAKSISPHFKTVQATDISPKQLDYAIKGDNIHYQRSPAELSPFSDNSFDLITVGQAIHWFKANEFYKECTRVGKPNSILACFGYSPVRFNGSFDRILNSFYCEIIYSYWETERRIVEDQYASLYFPFEEIISPEFKLQLEWTLKEVEGYITTWSAVQKYIKENGINPVDSLMKQIKPLWTNERESLYFPVFLKLGLIKK